MSKLTMIDEQYPSVVDAVFHDREGARRAEEALARELGAKPQQVEIVAPGDPALERKVEPDNRGIAHTLVRSHVILGVSGLLAGLLLAAVLTTVGPVVTRSSPVLTFIALGLIFPFFGLLIAGAISLRPDHDPVIAETRHASSQGEWTVVMHCSDEEEKRRAAEILSRLGSSPTETL